MTRVEIGNATLYLGDCREILPTLDRVDVVITDPPYDEKMHDGHLSKAADRQGLGFENLEDFDGLVNSCVNMALRWVLMTCATSHCLEAMNRPDFVRMGVWVKPNAAPQFTGDRPGYGWEAVALFHRKGRKKWNGGGHHAVWTHNIESGLHPTQKPLGLLYRWVDQFTDRGESILDPFMGSGTTGVAGITMGRKFVGIERDPKHFETACRRIEDAQRQASLLDAYEQTDKASEQLGLDV